MCRYDRNVDNLVADVALQISMGLFLLVHEPGRPDKRGNSTIQVQVQDQFLVSESHASTCLADVFSTVKKKGPFCRFMCSSSKLCKC